MTKWMIAMISQIVVLMLLKAYFLGNMNMATEAANKANMCARYDAYFKGTDKYQYLKLLDTGEGTILYISSIKSIQEAE